MALLLLFITTCTCEWPPPNSVDISLDQPQWNIAAMYYSFEFYVSCDVEVVQTLVMNYSSGNFKDVRILAAFMMFIQHYILPHFRGF